MVRTRHQVESVKADAAKEARLPYAVLVLLELGESMSFVCSLVSKNCSEAMQSRWPLRSLKGRMVRFCTSSRIAATSIPHLEWALAAGCPSTMICHAVARMGTLAMLQAAHQRCPWGPKTMSNAVASGSTTKVKWLLPRFDLSERKLAREWNRIEDIHVSSASAPKVRQLAGTMLDSWERSAWEEPHDVDYHCRCPKCFAALQLGPEDLFKGPPLDFSGLF